ncbi:hypothetical protein NHH03_00640 [Stieleria sp. TO1_6]|uniref:hypothetical protein n=1 Tax=Stieleria tagensis TaxID=2956795 RepID=UPI00209B58D0|nr:hypothetical protein [Stieleria tagensis]MCO8120223.1 hypothetical protein [Stieleria tagensis]
MALILSLAAIFTAATLPASHRSPSTTRAKVDLVELNHFLDDHGREVFRQVVFYDWSRRNRQFEVRAWRLIKDPSQLPRRQFGGDGYLIRWQDKSNTREVIAGAMRETWSQQDPERVNRKLLPESQRRPLWSQD